jgi:hypothetical protein
MVRTEGLRPMKRSIAALISAVLFALIAAGSAAAAAPSAPGGAMSGSACLDASSILHVTVLWDAEKVNPAKDLTISTKFSGGSGVPFTGKNTVSAPVPTTGSDSFGFVLSQGSTWSEWLNIANSANGAFKDKAPTLTQPAGGWPAC